MLTSSVMRYFNAIHGKEDTGSADERALAVCRLQHLPRSRASSANFSEFCCSNSATIPSAALSGGSWRLSFAAQLPNGAACFYFFSSVGIGLRIGQ